jgi:hypothetical protein
MKNMIAMTVGTLLLMAADVYATQIRTMMNGASGGMWGIGGWVGGYGVLGGLLLMVIAVAGLVVLIVRKKEE